MPKFRGRRYAAPPARRQAAEAVPLPAPIGGWISNQNLAAGDVSSCRVGENVVFTERGWRVRKGRFKYATVATSAQVTSIFEFVLTSGLRKLFAANATEIMDISSVADPDTKVTAAVTGQTSGDYSTIQVSTSAGNYLIAVNGDDDPQYFDSSSWSDTTFSITMPGGVSHTPSDFNYVMLHQNRIWYAAKNSLDLYYSAVDTIGGNYTLFTLNTVFEKGGSILFMATWSVDAGNGPQNRAVFVSTEGEIAVYVGINPNSSTTWTLVGHYTISKPAGKHAWFRTAGDIVICCADGAIPLSQILVRDPAELELSAISRPIEPDWRSEFSNRLSSKPWSAMQWQANAIALFSLPHTSGSGSKMFVVNVETRAWSLWTNWDVQAMSVYGDQAYFGDSDGVIWRMENGGFDGGTTPYFVKVQYNAMHAGAFGRYKQAKQMRIYARSSVVMNPKLSIGKNYSEEFPTPPDAVYTGVAGAVWGSFTWGDAVWGSAGEELTSGAGQNAQKYGWCSVAAEGEVFSPQIQLTIGDIREPDFELVSTELMLTYGAMVA